MLCKILKPFEFAASDGSVRRANADSLTEIPDDYIRGLTAEGYVEPASPAKTPLENKDAGAAPENKASEVVEEIDIPEGWLTLPWPELRSLAAKFSAVPVTDKDSCIDAIEAELANRDAAGSTAE